MSADGKDSVALWYAIHRESYYELCRSEEAAASLGVGMEENGQAAVLGVQFADGRTIESDNWPAYKAAQERSWRPEPEPPRPPVPVRKAVDPFRGRPLEIKASEPSWLGRPA